MRLRWKFIIPAASTAVLAVLFAVFMMDTMIHGALVAAGERMFGARVEIEHVRTRLSDLSVTVTGVSVADRSHPMRDLFSMKRVSFSLEPLPLLRKKFIIDHMSVEGLTWGTARSSSGALQRRRAERVRRSGPGGKTSVTDRLLASLEEKGKSAVTALPAAGILRRADDGLKDLASGAAFAPEDLETVREIDRLQTRLKEKYAGYERTIAGLSVEERVEAFRSAFEDLKDVRVESPADAAALQEKIARLRSEAERLRALSEEIDSLKSRMAVDYGGKDALLDSIDRARERDVEAISRRLRIPSLTFDSIARSLFGNAWVGRVENALRYVRLARKYMPPRRKDDRKVVRTRMKGVDVAFPVKDVPPDLLIRTVSLSGSTGGPGKDGDPLDFSGEIRDITSDPVLLGRPCTLSVSGRQSGRTFSLEGLFDHTVSGSPKDEFSVVMKGLSAANIGLPDSEYLPSFKGSSGSVDMRFVMGSDVYRADMRLSVSNIAPRSAEGNELLAVVQSAWEGVPAVTVDAQVTGTEGETTLSVRSNVDSLLADALKRVAGERVARMREQLRAEIERSVAGKQAELLSSFATDSGASLARVAGLQTELRKALSGGEALLNEKENEARMQVDAEKRRIEEQLKEEKRKAEEELRRKAAEQLKGLFN